MQRVCVCVCANACVFVIICMGVHAWLCVVHAPIFKTVSNSKLSEKKKLPRLFNVFFIFKNIYIYYIYLFIYVKRLICSNMKIRAFVNDLAKLFILLVMNIEINLGNVVRVHLPFLYFIQPREILL